MNMESFNIISIPKVSVTMIPRPVFDKIFLLSILYETRHSKQYPVSCKPKMDDLLTISDSPVVPFKHYSLVRTMEMRDVLG